MQNACVQKKNKVLIIIMALLLLLSSFNLNIFNSSADIKKYPFDKTNVLKDLQSSSNFNIYNYPYSTNEAERIINFVEWEYSQINPEGFALYIYLYNPKKTEWETDSNYNNIKMAVKYKTDPNQSEYDSIITADSSPVEYDTFKLVYCNKSKGDEYDGLFYKFRIVDHKSDDGLTIQERVNSSERRYDVQSISLCKEGGNIEQLKIGGTYRFTGYAKGCSYDQYNTSTLRNTEFLGLETFVSGVQNESALIESSSLPFGHQYEINSLYFPIPEKYFTQYGNLQKIKLDWYEYKTTPIFTAYDYGAADGLYKNLNKMVGVDIENRGGPDKAFVSTNKYKVYLNREVYEDPELGAQYRYDVGYNLPNKAINLGAEDKYDSYNGVVENAITEIQWLTDMLPQEIPAGLKSYAKKYSFAKKGYLPTWRAGEEVSADLFLDMVDEGRTKGYNCVELDVGKNNDIKTYNDDDLMQKWCEAGLFTDKNKLSAELEDVKPIIFNVQNADDSSLLVTYNYDLKQMIASAKNRNERVVLLRYAVTDFWQEGFHTWINNSAKPTEKGELGVLTQKTMFYNALIDLTFQTNDTYIDMPIVQNPTAPIESDAEDDNTNNWFTGVIETIGAYGVLIIGIVGLLVLAFFIIKAIGSFMPGGTFARVIMIIIVVVLGYLGFLLGNWTFASIESLGGLM